MRMEKRKRSTINLSIKITCQRDKKKMLLFIPVIDWNNIFYMSITRIYVLCFCTDILNASCNHSKYKYPKGLIPIASAQKLLETEKLFRKLMLHVTLKWFCHKEKQSLKGKEKLMICICLFICHHILANDNCGERGVRI